MNKISNNILIIGGPNTGKTHFGGQLYGRLDSRQFKYKISQNNRPIDLTIFKDVLEKLSEGKRADHTEASANRNIELIVDDENGNEIVFTFPDYAGEQVNKIIDYRRINNIWKDYIDKSNSWLLFIRINDLRIIEDIINRGIPDANEIQKRKAQAPPVKVSDAAFFVELLQMFLFVKGISILNKVAKPNLTIILSCWDELKLPTGSIPYNILKEKLPLLFSFVSNAWDINSFNIIGLSSTEKSLTDEPDDEYIDKTPIKFGYIINTKGIEEKDLTLSIPTFIGRK